MFRVKDIPSLNSHYSYYKEMMTLLDGELKWYKWQR